MKNIFTLICCFFSLYTFTLGDHAELVIYHPEGMVFFLEVDGRKINYSPDSRVKVTNLTRNQYDIRVRFADRRLGQVFFDEVKLHRNHRNIFQLVSGYRGDCILEFEGKKPLFSSQVPKYPTNRCYQPMDRYVFSDIAYEMEGERFDSDMLRLGKRLLRNECLSSRQVRKLMDLLSFEDSKLAFAKFCFDRTIDPERYHIVSDGFSWPASKRELKRYIERSSRDYYPPNHEDESCSYPDHDHSNYGKHHQGKSPYGGGYGKHSQGKYRKNNHGKNNHGKYKNYPPKPKYQGSCAQPIHEAKFRKELRRVNMVRSDAQKLSIAKSIIRSNCLKSIHIAEFMETMRHEENRLKLAKYAYDYVYDPESYHQVNRAFAYRNSSKELDRYMR